MHYIKFTLVSRSQNFNYFSNNGEISIRSTIRTCHVQSYVSNIHATWKKDWYGTIWNKSMVRFIYSRRNGERRRLKGFESQKMRYLYILTKINFKRILNLTPRQCLKIINISCDISIVAFYLIRVMKYFASKYDFSFISTGKLNIPVLYPSRQNDTIVWLFWNYVICNID